MQSLLGAWRRPLAVDIFPVQGRGGEDAGGVVERVGAQEEAQARRLEARPAGGAGKRWNQHGELHMFGSRSFRYEDKGSRGLQWPAGRAQ